MLVSIAGNLITSVDNSFTNMQLEYATFDLCVIAYNILSIRLRLYRLEEPFESLESMVNQVVKMCLK